MSELTHGDQARICASLEISYAEWIVLHLSLLPLISWRTNDERKYNPEGVKRNADCHTYMISTLIDGDKIRGAASELDFSPRQSAPR